ncbi:hypothetical protein AAVH_28487 [Aphelenchoides avenae]|nr:hypothetical protein AAVH_28487 [Aphelenchus avenae]
MCSLWCSRLLLGIALLAWIFASAASTLTPARSRARRADSARDRGANAVTATTNPEQTVTTNASGVYCPTVNGISWTLFREKCYYRYYAPFGIKGTSAEDGQTYYKTWFEARAECAKIGAKLASVHDQATQEMLLQLIAVNETLTSLDETTWIGLQEGTLDEVGVEDRNGTIVRYENQTGCYWPAGVRPRLAKNDLCPENAVDECSITYNDTFQGLWEDGKLYDEDESADFWSPEEPNQRRRDDDDSSGVDHCIGKKFRVDKQSKAYCQRGVGGKWDQLQHCALILPPEEKMMQIRGDNDPGTRLVPGKWVDYWCWMKLRGYICERPAKRSDASEDSMFTPGGEETESSPTTATCGVDDDCYKRADEVVGGLNATRIGYTVVVETMALRDAAAGKTWLGGSAPFGDSAQTAIYFGRSIAKLSVEQF